MKNVEIKAKVEEPQKVRDYLKSQKADYQGEDHQVDTYFNVSEGRLKLRQGKIDNYLIYYKRPNSKEPSQSDLTLYNTSGKDIESLKKINSEALGVWKVVNKKREIYFLENIRFHIDSIEGLGNFFEIEVVDREGNLERDKLLERCNFHFNALGIKDEDLVSESYSDMI